jgi:hypothetical protein
VDEIELLRKMISKRRSEEVSLNAACKQIALELSKDKWTANYLKTLLGKKPPNPSAELRAAIRKLYRKKTRKPRQKRYWLKIEAGSEIEKNEWSQRIPMNRRQELFREEIDRLNREMAQVNYRAVFWIEDK